MSKRTYSYTDAGKRIKSERIRQQKRSQMDVAEDLDIPYMTYRNIEQGQQAMSIDKAVKIANYYDISLDYLLFGADASLDGNIQFIENIRRIETILAEIKQML